MAMGDNIIANYIQSPKTLESFYQLPNSITRHNTFYKSAEKICIKHRNYNPNPFTKWGSIEHYTIIACT
jgi:hypothetical protein